MDERFKKLEKIPVQNSGKRMRPEKDPLKEFSWESAPNWLVRLVQNENFFGNDRINMKQFMEQVMRELSMTPKEQAEYMRPDPVPYSYRLNYQYLKENEPKLNANPTGLTIEQILGQDRHFHRTYVNNNVTAQILAKYGCTGYMTGKKWEMKHHELTNYGWPQFSQTFRKLGAITVGPEGKKSTGYGWGAKYEIPFTMMDQAAGGIYDIEYWHIFFLAQQMGIFGDERLLLGGAGRNTAGKGAPDLTGLINNSGTVTLTSPNTDCGFSSGKSDFDDNFADILSSWYGNSVFGAQTNSNVYLSMAGIAAETTLHDAGYGDQKTEYQRIQGKWIVSGELSSWYVSQNLSATALASLTVSTQEYLAIKASPNYIRRTVVYPLQRKILSEAHKEYPDDIAFAYITGDILQVYDSNAIITCTTHALTQVTGWRMNGLFMDSNTVYQKGYQAPIR